MKGRRSASATAQAAADEAHVRRCLELADRGAGRTAPNPLVGSIVLDRRGRVAGEGYHRRAGEPHAEVLALRDAGAAARGGTLYVNLEPCGHHGRTPPCSDAILESGVARVVFGMPDPKPNHRGARALRRAGVEVVAGVLREQCEAANRAFLTRAREGRPHVLLKAAVTLDGRIATRTGASQWITSQTARADVHRQRDRADVICAGVGTVLADDPRLTVRGVRGGRDPIRLILDSRLRTPPDALVMPGAHSDARVIVATTRDAPEARARRLERAGAEVWRLRGKGGGVSPAALLRRLAREPVLSMLVEGGAVTHGAFLDADLADELRLYVAPMVFGGDAPAWAAGEGVAAIARAPRFSLAKPALLDTGELVITARRR